MTNKNETQIEKLMRVLDINQQEAEELIQFDNGEIENEEVDALSKKAKAVAKEMSQVSRAPKEEKPKMAGVTTQTRKKKEDPIKQQIISAVAEALEQVEGLEHLDITNIEKTILFSIGDENFEIDLKKKRAKK